MDEVGNYVFVPIQVFAERVKNDSEVRVYERVVVMGLGMARREAVK